MRKRQFRAKVHLDDKNFRKLTKQVEKSGLSREAYLRQLVASYTPRAMPQMDYARYKNELHAIGVNMNQIAARANATGFVDDEAYQRNLKELDKLTSEILATVTAPAEEQETNESEEKE